MEDEVDRHNRSLLARSEAPLLVKGDRAVLGELTAVRDPGRRVCFLVHVLGASKSAGEVRADRDHMPAGRTQTQHRVKACDSLYLRRLEADQVRGLTKRVP